MIGVSTRLSGHPQIPGATQASGDLLNLLSPPQFVQGIQVMLSEYMLVSVEYHFIST